MFFRNMLLNCLWVYMHVDASFTERWRTQETRGSYGAVNIWLLNIYPEMGTYMQSTSGIRDYCGREGRKKFRMGWWGGLSSITIFCLWFGLLIMCLQQPQLPALGLPRIGCYHSVLEGKGFRRSYSFVGLWMDAGWGRVIVFRDESLMSSLVSCGAFDPW